MDRECFGSVCVDRSSDNAYCIRTTRDLFFKFCASTRALPQGRNMGATNARRVAALSAHAPPIGGRMSVAVIRNGPDFAFWPTAFASHVDLVDVAAKPERAQRFVVGLWRW